jgi:hypothetical protein
LALAYSSGPSEPATSVIPLTASARLPKSAFSAETIAFSCFFRRLTQRSIRSMRSAALGAPTRMFAAF